MSIGSESDRDLTHAGAAEDGSGLDNPSVVQPWQKFAAGDTNWPLWISKSLNSQKQVRSSSVESCHRRQ